MLQELDTVPWAELEHAYGPADDVPGLLRKLLDPNPKVRSATMRELYGNVFHQGTRYPAAPYVVPFLIELCASPLVPNRGDLLFYWGSLITGYFTVKERPTWGDGERVYDWGQVVEVDADDPFVIALHRIYTESLKGHALLCRLLTDDETGVRAGAAYVLACLPTLADQSLPNLETQLRVELDDVVRGSIVFALGELGAINTLRRIALEDESAAVRCMATCQLARLDATPTLIGPLLTFVAAPIEEYQHIRGAGGRSTGDAAYAISHLPVELQRMAIPALCAQLDQARTFDTIPLVSTLLSAAFSPRQEPLLELTDLQRGVLTCMVATQELWSIVDIMRVLRAYGLPEQREACAKLVGVEVTVDEALRALHSGLLFSEMGFLDKGREEIEKALVLDASVFERVPAPDMSWLLYAKAFAESDPERARTAFGRASSINANVIDRVDPAWRLADLLRENDASS